MDPGAVIVVTGAPGVGKSTVSHLVASAFDRSVHLRVDEFMAAIVSGWVDPNRPDAGAQHEAVGAAAAVSTMTFAEHGYTTVVDGYLFPDGVAGLAEGCEARGLECHYVVLTADLDTCWTRASGRADGPWPLERGAVEAVHQRFDALDLDRRHLVDATGSADDTSDAVLSAFRAGRLAASSGS